MLCVNGTPICVDGTPLCPPEGGGVGDACGECSGDTPAQIQVVIAGFEDGTCTTGDCDQFNGTYTLTQQSGDACAWDASFSADMSGCGGSSGTATLTATYSGGTMTVQLYHPDYDGAEETIEWQGSLSSTCSGWSGESVAFNGAVSSACDVAEPTPATCSVSAVA